jgi:chromosomal replication initiation ATPase DnaA
MADLQQWMEKLNEQADLIKKQTDEVRYRHLLKDIAVFFATQECTIEGFYEGIQQSSQANKHRMLSTRRPNNVVLMRAILVKAFHMHQSFYCTGGGTNFI